MLAFESKLERDLYTLLEFDPIVRTVREQPVRIPFLDSRGRLQHYTPDCLIEYFEDGTHHRVPMLVEVKYRADLFRFWPELHPKLRAAARYALGRRQAFRILTEREIHGPRLENARWLLAYRAVPVPQSEVAAICDILRSLRTPSTPLGLLATLTDSEPRREELLVAIWFAIANGYIAAHLDTKLSMSSSIWVAS